MITDEEVLNCKSPPWPEPTARERISRALIVLAGYPELPGVHTINRLMWPYKMPPITGQLTSDEPGPWLHDPNDVHHAAIKVLASAFAALLKAAHPQVSEQIQKEVAEYLTSEIAADTPCDGSLFQAAVLPDLAQQRSG